MSHRDDCPSWSEAKREGERAAERGYYSHSNPYGGVDGCPEASRAWSHGHRIEQERVEERQADEAAAERRAEERRAEQRHEEEAYWDQQRQQEEQEYYESLAAFEHWILELTEGAPAGAD